MTEPGRFTDEQRTFTVERVQIYIETEAEANGCVQLDCSV